MSHQKIILAGGCFWCLEHAFLEIPGMLSVKSGYTGGSTAHPTYEQVCTGLTGHYEAVELEYDAQEITLIHILNIFWKNIDPLDAEGQFADRGPQYRTAIFYFTLQQKSLAEASKKWIQGFFDLPIATPILPAAPFFLAEEHHQKYCRKQPSHYKAYAATHTPYLEKLWEGKPL